eukprot:COSAG01_NODE_3267_length_6330_cov_133.385331_2_plen_95_part_00
MVLLGVCAGVYCRTAVPWCLLPKVLLSSTVVQTGSPIPNVRSTGSNVSKMYSRAVHSTAHIRASTPAAEFPRRCPCSQKKGGFQSRWRFELHTS